MNECFFWSRRCSRKLRHFVEQDSDDAEADPGGLNVLGDSLIEN